MIAAEHRIAKSKAQVVSHMTGGVKAMHDPAIARNSVPMRKRPITAEPSVDAFTTTGKPCRGQRPHNRALTRIRSPESQHRRTGELCQWPRQRRMIQMAVGYKDMADTLVRREGRQNCLLMRFI
jgi:hypothetical protein